MEKRRRYERIKAIVRKLNIKRRQQARQIEILCNDMIGSQREFITRLDMISRKADFYEKLLECHSIEAVLYAAEKTIREQLPQTNIVFFLRHENGHQIYPFVESSLSDASALESSFTDELVLNVCKLNKVCSLDELCCQGLQCNPVSLNQTSAVTLPLGGGRRGAGFVLIYRKGEKFDSAKLAGLNAQMPGLTRAVVAKISDGHAANAGREN